MTKKQASRQEKTKTVEVDDLENLIMVQEEIINPEAGEKETVTVQKHHTETRVKKTTLVSYLEHLDNFGYVRD